MDNTPTTSRLLRQREVLSLVPIARSTLWLWVSQGRFPQPIKLGPRTTAWREEDVNRFIEEASKGAAA